MSAGKCPDNLSQEWVGVKHENVASVVSYFIYLRVGGN